MPFLPNNLLDEEQKKKLETQNSGGIGISGESGVMSSSNSSGNNLNSKSEKRSGSFTNLNQYLDANKDNAGAMADKVTGQIDQTASDASNKLNQVKSAAPNAVQALTGQNLQDNYLSNPGLLNDSQKSEYKSLKSTGGYNGPQSIYDINGFNEAESQSKKAAQSLEQSKSEGGRQELLVDAYKRPTYSQGQKSLDQLLVQNDPTAKQKFNDVQAKWAGINSLLDGTTSDINSRIESNKSTALANKNLFIPAEEQAQKSLIDPIRARAEKALQDRPVLQQSYQNDLTDDVLNQSTLDALGLSEGSNLWGLNLNDYMTYDQSQLNPDMVANAEERSKYAALMSLLDKDATEIGSTEKSYNPVQFNKDRFLADQLNSKNEFENFAKNKNYSVEKVAPVSDGQLIVQGTGLANANLWDYLNNNNLINSQFIQSAGGPGTNNYASQALADQAKQDVLNQILADLSTYNYDRKVTKG